MPIKYSGLVVILMLSACAMQQPKIQPETISGKCDQKFNYSIDFSRFDETAQQIAHATGCFIETDLSKTGAIKPHAVIGYMSPRQAVHQAIKGTSLKITKESDHIIVVE